jgi:hypothetical protein
MRKKDSPPTSINILGKRFKLTVVDGNHYEDFGEMRSGSQEILINSGQAFEQFRDTVCHEIAHAIEHQVGMDIDHRFIHALGAGFSQILRDNPELTKWLMKKAPV